MIILTTGLFFEQCVSDPTREEGGNLNYGPSGAEKATLAVCGGGGGGDRHRQSRATVFCQYPATYS